MKRLLIFLSALLFTLILNFSVLYAYGWGFSKNNDHRQPEIGKYLQEIEGTSSYYIGDVNSKNIYLTFDAGYDNGNILKIIDILNQKNIPATFFVTGDFIESSPDIIKYIYDTGLTVGNHTYSHKCINAISMSQLEEEISKVERLYFEVTQAQMAKQFRPPKGEFDKKSLQNVEKLGYTTYFWSLAFKDWDTKNQHGKEYSYQNVMKNLHNGAIILLHTVSNDNVLALEDIIDDAIKEGYTFKSLEYLKESIKDSFYIYINKYAL